MSATQGDIKATIELLRLKQTGSARDYSTKFLELLSKTTKETYLAARFFLGLKEEIQEAIHKDGELPATFEDMARKATTIDNYLHDKRRKRGLYYSAFADDADLKLDASYHNALNV
ncbi:hypothetical protein FGSG_11580 [Fusarium graminearum PH-1]|uniref:Chromosome 1, complete genome n=1 Tax=Gibberella zeae (strain ATCC MYA-4620 / CBS 123657 / FGSC 9075 / NRRL 31084 / PH-1) TaxID=229533 RepID=I1S426_GIBZE|nr:hypothetical protein FGSG_11580 [Fusarium graminearum PH-1]ESU08355.1 hypothetical protein FGSG_11580 [Fusarium graminearum PH-1]CEF71809.1 unnamed protein product [Fusarium graminearum]|eukprot:XP_011315563.1 hypothetical protein FGSG_11580 [Fusarium graminearum PH-1]